MTRSAEAAWRDFQAAAHFGNLDGLRCISILAVIWHHGPGGDLRGAAGCGFLGVPLFFAISGFLITTLLLREQQRAGGISLGKFYVRRSLRIFPLYFAALALYCALVYALRRDTESGRKFFANLPYFLTYTSNWFVGVEGTFAFAWSLAAEEQFYSTWPVMLRFLRSAWAGILIAALLAAVVGWNALSAGVAPAGFPSVLLANVPMSICWGCLAALALQSRRGFALAWKALGHRWASAILLLACAAAIEFVRPVQIPAHLLFALLVASCVVREDIAIAPAMRQPLVVHLGRISYGMYLLHGLVFDAVGAFGANAHGFSGFLVVLVLTALISTVSFKYFESPFLRMKSRFSA